MTHTSNSNELEKFRNPQLPVDARVQDLLGRLTLDEKIGLLSGGTPFDSRSVDRLGVPPLKMTDGPHGVRNGKATCFPVSIAMASTWNPALIEKVGAAMASEARAKGLNVLLGPCVNIQRTPLNGRNFESFGEDPCIAARMAVSYINGVQSRKVGASVKHFACNNQELGRFRFSVDIDERTLREIYLPAFEAAVQEANVWTVMSAHNRLNGIYCSENPHLLREILKDEWGFKGLVVSDWGGVRSTVEAAKGGMDLEMPGPGDRFAAPMRQAVKEGKVRETEIDGMASRILRVMCWEGLFDGPAAQSAGALDTPEHRALARKVAQESIILLKNDGNVLPLKSKDIKSIAVIGPNAAVPRPGGGGSSVVEPFYMVTPLDGLREKCGNAIKVGYAKGALLPSEFLPIDPKCLVHPSGSNELPGLRGEYFANKDLAGDPVLVRVDPQVFFDWGSGSPDPKVPADYFSARWTGYLVPPTSGTYRLGITSDDGMRIYLDGKPLIDNWRDHGPESRTSLMTLEAGRRYAIRIEYYDAMGGATARFGWAPPGDLLAEARELAASSDVAIVFAGLSADDEGEDVDRKDLRMPGPQDELIMAVSEANSNTIVVLINGSPVEMQEWVDHVPALLEAWYPGQEGGHAIADVLFGAVNPSGKLTVTLPKRLEDSPAFGNYRGENDVVRYTEGLYVGYRHFDKRGIEPCFPFGHGLSYTTYKYDNLKVTGKEVSLDLANTGDVAGQEVVQLYIRDPDCSVERPVKELKAFRKVSFQPGEKKKIVFQLTDQMLSFYDPQQKRWIAEPGTFEILIGSSSRDIRLTGRKNL